MRYICDFHIHSKYSRATSRDMNLDVLAKWAKIKGINILGTGDFTHPEWFRELREKLEPAETGLYRLKSEIKSTKSETEEIRFILTSEISCIYSKKGKTRRIHLLVFSPNFETVEKINANLGWIGNIKSDGRPILGLDAKELAKIILNLNPKCLVIPAHAWTPWFSIFGSMSGFDSIEECFEEYSKYIYAIETGLSSDPKMNWRLSALDKITLISNSDSHSPQKIGREANVFEFAAAPTYDGIAEAIKDKSRGNFKYTVEFFPEEGKYHYDGHRLCQSKLSPEETKKYNGVCPKCGKPVIVGVMNRVDKLADRPEGFQLPGAIPFKSLIPLEEIIADANGTAVGTKAVLFHYQNLIKELGSEFNILLEAPYEQIKKFSDDRIAEGVKRVREGRVFIEPGYDGEYGKIKIFDKKEDIVSSTPKQKMLF